MCGILVHVCSLNLVHHYFYIYRVLGEIGSGNFGCVVKCVYNKSSSTKLEAAAKTLKEKYATMDKIKFLQEAAIMGQFHHNNIVQLYGVIVEGTPVSKLRETRGCGGGGGGGESFLHSSINGTVSSPLSISGQ